MTVSSAVVCVPFLLSQAACYGPQSYGGYYQTPFPEIRRPVFRLQVEFNGFRRFERPYFQQPQFTPYFAPRPGPIIIENRFQAQFGVPYGGGCTGRSAYGESPYQAQFGGYYQPQQFYQPQYTPPQLYAGAGGGPS